MPPRPHTATQTNCESGALENISWISVMIGSRPVKLGLRCGIEPPKNRWLASPTEGITTCNSKDNSASLVFVVYADYVTKHCRGENAARHTLIATQDTDPAIAGTCRSQREEVREFPARPYVLVIVACVEHEQVTRGDKSVMYVGDEISPVLEIVVLHDDAIAFGL
jgi:hypothetical protein